jgi:hypothetical protein
MIGRGGVVALMSPIHRGERENSGVRSADPTKRTIVSAWRREGRSNTGRSVR